MTTTTEARTATPEALKAARATLAAERRRVAALALFARRMSHDMSNFVTVVRTYSELLLADLPPSGTTFADVQEIHRAADAMIDYLHRIVKFARTTGMPPGAIHLDDVVADELRVAAPAARLRVQLASEASVHAEAAGLADAVREVVSNACEASPPDSIVHVRSWCEQLNAPLVDGEMPIEAGHWAILEIADDGPGFPDDILHDALDPFVTTKQAVRGAGFGLALARSAVWSSGGQLVIETPNPAAPGTRVRIWLPTVANQDTPGDGANQPDTATPPARLS